ncbi:hypothetical protein [Vitiosangium sp. GDMCC 1.1324]|uniref:hypothetical protein n=1 Tax=Vitiosangium sp. (strain GDMCC 1.1324) TaxID=2138576 RepID=UPI0011B606C0|nr:hypothetical protein [Vitiosangium sp. GDMCC 1.1324]
MAGWLGLYAEDTDVLFLRDRLNEDSEIAFLMPEGPGRWRAVWQLDELLGKTMLWHVPGGPLPLLRPGERDSIIEEPFAGWEELRPGMDYSVPYFGPGWPSTLLLEIYTRGWRGLRADVIPLSGISWYGRTNLKGPSASTRKWWSRFRGWMRNQSVCITRSGTLDGPQPDIWAMPAALRSIRVGVERGDWPLVRFPPARIPHQVAMADQAEVGPALACLDDRE